MLLYPFRTGLVRRRFVETPDEPVAFLFAILRTTVPPTDPAGQLADNRVLYERARAVGGKRYPVGSVPFSPPGLGAHYGRDYPAFVAAKATWDPRRVLCPGRASSGRRARALPDPRAGRTRPSAATGPTGWRRPCRAAPRRCAETRS